MKRSTLNLAKGILLCTFLSITLSSCNKDRLANKDIEGQWEVQSLTIDGVEQMDVILTSFELEFKSDSDIGGESEWDLIGTDGSATKVETDYEISDDGTEIDFDGDKFDMDLDRDNLELSGNLGGTRWEIEADRD